MTTTLILLNIGNTHVRSATARLRDRRWAIEPGPDARTADFIEAPQRLGLALPNDTAEVAVACVVPAARTAVHRLFPRKRVFFLHAEAVARPDFSHVDASTVGADRAANAVGALAIAGAPVIVVDAGTALTTEILDAAGIFRGGAIAPGRAMLRRALSEFTAQLPYIPPAAAPPPRVGTNTGDAIRSGADHMYIAGFRALVEAGRDTVGVSDCPVLVTGGDAPFLLSHATGDLPNVLAAPPDLTFRGLAIAAASFFQERNDP